MERREVQGVADFARSLSGPEREQMIEMLKKLVADR